ncbi:MAG: hypothetical protein ACLR2E_08670 [Lachnospiraceae bacterium]
MKDYGIGTLVGTTTFGKASFSGSWNFPTARQ